MTKEELEKENAELKETVTKMNNVITETFSNLTKAKEVIKKLIEAIHIWDCKNLEEVEAEAEQFLKESE